MIPASIPQGIAALSAAVKSLGDLTTATRYDKEIVQRQGDALVASINTAIASAAGSLDAGDPTGFPGDLVTDLIALQTASAEQSALVIIRGFVGRAVLNLDQA